MQAALRIYEQIEDPWRERARAQLEEWRAENCDEPRDSWVATTGDG